MKRLIICNGTMGVGKSATCVALTKRLAHNVFLDGDWCWNMHPFIVNQETTTMVMKNITFMLNNFLACSAYENVIFGWVMHEQSILDDVLAGLNLNDVEVSCFTLTCDEETLKKRILKDVAEGKRNIDVLSRSMERMKQYQNMKTIKIDTSLQQVDEVAKLIETHIMTEKKRKC